MTKAGNFYRTLTGRGVNLTSYAILLACKEYTMTIGTLAEELGISSAAVNGAVYKLNEAGLLFIRSGIDDKRKRIVKLTATAARLLERAAEALAPSTGTTEGGAEE